MTKRQKSDMIHSLAWGITILFGFAIIASMDVIVEKLCN